MYVQQFFFIMVVLYTIYRLSILGANVITTDRFADTQLGIWFVKVQYFTFRKQLRLPLLTSCTSSYLWANERTIHNKFLLFVYHVDNNYFIAIHQNLQTYIIIIYCRCQTQIYLVPQLLHVLLHYYYPAYALQVACVAATWQLRYSVTRAEISLSYCYYVVYF